MKMSKRYWIISTTVRLIAISTPFVMLYGLKTMAEAKDELQKDKGDVIVSVCMVLFMILTVIWQIFDQYENEKEEEYNRTKTNKHGLLGHNKSCWDI